MFPRESVRVFIFIIIYEFMIYEAAYKFSVIKHATAINYCYIAFRYFIRGWSECKNNHLSLNASRYLLLLVMIS